MPSSRHFQSWTPIVLGFALAACGSEPRDGGGVGEPTTGGGSGASGGGASGGSSGDDSGSPEGSGTSGASGGSGGDSSASTSGGGPSDGTSGDDIRFDLGYSTEGGGAEGGERGCEKIDFLFVIDNSGSMGDEQQNLVNSFPGFMQTIQSTLMAQNFHLLVTDTDAESLSFTSVFVTPDGATCEPAPQCCLGACFGGNVSPPPAACNGTPCADIVRPTGCDVTLGAGKDEDFAQNDCGISTGARYMVDSQPDLPGTFECVALFGAGGDGNERPMEAMTQAIGPLSQAGGCNEGFVRDDAILVVTFITDEAETGSMGDPASWRQAVVDAKNGDENAAVVLGLIGDGTCADPAPRLREFAESFPRGQWASVCASDYAPFFADAVSAIDAACDDFVPPG